jgi:hypothetical protein
MKCDEDICNVSSLFQGQWEFDHTALAQSVVIDRQKYKEYIEMLVMNEDLRIQMGRQSRDLSVKLYGLPVIVNAYENLWLELNTVARKCSFLGPKPASYEKPNYFAAFGHYPTHIIPDNAEVVITSSGRDAAAARRTIPAEHWASRLAAIDNDILRMILHEVGKVHVRRQGRRTGDQKITVREIIQEASRREGMHADRLKRHLLWLMKYGYIEAKY